jgi:tetratricopeptide (TPR) repeat protein
VKLPKTIDAAEFVELIKEPLQRHDTCALAGLIQNRWSCEQMISLLASREADVRKLAALALGVAGDRHCITALAGCLRDGDPMVNQMAEHALWTVWFRCGSKEAQELVQRGTCLLNDKRWSEALGDFTDATRCDPTYAEARNQLAITHYLLEDFHSSIDDGQVVVQLMPTHFGAWAGLGHCYAHLGDIRRATRCYRHALGINPYLQCVRQILGEINAGQCDTGIHQRDITP